MVKRIIFIAVMLSCGAFLWGPIYAQDAVKVKKVVEVTADSLNMRNGPGTNFASLHVVKKGDKLAVISGEKDGKICCLMLIKADEFGAMVKDLLGPLMQDIIAGEK